MSVEIELEKRNCANCGRSFKVMAKSLSQHCNEVCKNASASGIAGRGERPRASKENVRRTETIRVELMPRGQKEPGNAFAARVAAWPKKKEIEKNPANITSDINNLKTKGENKMQNETASVSVKPPASLTTKTEPNDSPKSRPQGIVETPRASSVEQLPTLEVESSDILSLSKESARRLMELMRATVTDDDLEKQKQGNVRVETYKIETAIKCANAIASIVQVNVNLLKAMKGK